MIDGWRDGVSMDAALALAHRSMPLRSTGSRRLRRLPGKALAR